jgi:nitroreductase
MNTMATLMNERISANSYNTEKQLSDTEVEKLIELATKAPSAFNLQNWRVIAVRSQDAKKRLFDKAYNQQKVLDASVTFIICGTLDQPNTIAQALTPTLDAGIIDQDTYNGWVGAVNSMYGNNPTLQRDEAIRSGSLLAMSLMLIAQGQGLVSCPMIGFDQAGVINDFNLSDTDVPVMLITVGYPGTENWPQKPRKALKDILTVV